MEGGGGDDTCWEPEIKRWATDRGLLHKSLTPIPSTGGSGTKHVAGYVIVVHSIKLTFFVILVFKGFK